VPFEAAHKYDRVVRSLKEKPEDYLRAFLQIDSAYRALLLFTYQSWLWNEGVRRLLQIALPRTSLFPLRYQAGTLLFHQDADPETLRWLRGLTFPLLAPDSTIEEPRVREAVEWVLGKEKLKLEQLRIVGAERMLYFKHEERSVLVQPSKLVLGRTQADELNRGFGKLNVAFTLPPGSYATLVVKRLFHRTAREDTPDEIRATPGSGRPAPEGELQDAPHARSAPDARRGSGPGPGRPHADDRRRSPSSEKVRRDERQLGASRQHSAPVAPVANDGPTGYLARAKARKEAKAAARARQKLR
jgi:tRNA pseudouridine13 synthase